MGLYKRGPVWWMRFTYNGTLRRKSTETVDRKLAERIYHSVLGKIAEGKWFDRLPGDDTTFREMMDRYLTEHTDRNKALSSQRRDRGMRDRLSEFFGDMRLTAIRPRLIADYKSKRRLDGVSPKTINNELTLMSHAFNLCVKEWEWVRDNPMKRVSRVKVRKHLERWLTLEEEERLLAASPPWLQQLIVFAVSTGLRHREVLHLQWPEVDLLRKTITILEQKNKSIDTLPLNARALDVLKERAKVRHLTSKYVFFTATGNAILINNVLRGLYTAIEKANMRHLRFHDLRHTFATRLVQAGVDLYTVQKLGRWKTLSMLMRYAHHHSESLGAGAEVLDRVTRRENTMAAQVGTVELTAVCYVLDSAKSFSRSG